MTDTAIPTTPSQRSLNIIGYARRRDGRSYGGGLCDYGVQDILLAATYVADEPETRAYLVREVAVVIGRSEEEVDNIVDSLVDFNAR